MIAFRKVHKNYTIVYFHANGPLGGAISFVSGSVEEYSDNMRETFLTATALLLMVVENHSTILIMFMFCDHDRYVSITKILICCAMSKLFQKYLQLCPKYNNAYFVK